jgi:Cu/Ag efflux pump CusA
VIATGVGEGSAAAIEEQLTVPIEGLVRRAPSVAEVSSLSRAGLSIVTAFGREGSDPMRLGEEIRSALRTAPESTVLPAGAMPVVTVGLGGTALRYTVTSSALPATAVRSWHDRDLRPRLERLRGVAQVFTCGVERESEVRVDAARLASHSVRLGDLVAAVQRETMEPPVGRTASSGDVGSVRLSARAGAEVRVRDVATLAEMAGPVRCHCGRDGLDDVLEGIVLAQPGADVAALGPAAREILAEARRGLPPGMELRELGVPAKVGEGRPNLARLRAALPGGSGAGDVRRVGREIRRAIGRVPGLGSVVTEWGAPAEPPLLPGEVEVLVELAARSRWSEEPSGLDSLRRAIAGELRTLPGVAFRFLGAGGIAVRFFGPELEAGR